MITDHAPCAPPAGWRIPEGVLAGLRAAPRDRPVIVLLRHSVRDAIPKGETGHDLPITPAGVRLAEELGALLGDRLASIHSSPVPRCVQTAEAILSGADLSLPIRRDLLLGQPGVFVLEGELAWPHFERLGGQLMLHLCNEEEVLRGMADPDPAARYLLHGMQVQAGDRPGIHVFLTHDSILMPAAARLLGHVLNESDYPWFLDAAFFWPEADSLHIHYRDRSSVVMPPPAPQLTKRDAIDFARREIAATVGLESGARFFLAGGAFKSLLTGRPPRDLDLWASIEQDRAMLCATLEARTRQMTRSK